MYYDNLHAVIERYENSLPHLYGRRERDELFKWRAMKTWREEWYKPEGSFASFADRFNAARKDFGWFMDASRMHPSAGVVKLWEKEPEKVEHLFKDVLLTPSNGSAERAQTNMDDFLRDYELLRQKYYPANWGFKQDRHSASVFMVLNEPDFHYVYRASDANLMASYIDFERSIGSGRFFSLAVYYDLCGEIVSALRQHQSLLEKHFDYLSAEHYRDESLHLLAFDLMYCAHTAGFYEGLKKPSAARKVTVGAKKNTADLQLEAKRAQREALEARLAELEARFDEYEELSLLGVEVTSDQYGTGIVISQKVNMLTVRFAAKEVTFKISKTQPRRPRFEDDEAAVEILTEYGELYDEIKRIQRQLAELSRK